MFYRLGKKKIRKTLKGGGGGGGGVNYPST